MLPLEADTTLIGLFEDGSVKIVQGWFSYRQPDFTESDFIGLTQEEADSLVIERELHAIEDRLHQRG